MPPFHNVLCRVLSLNRQLVRTGQGRSLDIVLLRSSLDTLLSKVL